MSETPLEVFEALLDALQAERGDFAFPEDRAEWLRRYDDAVENRKPWHLLEIDDCHIEGSWSAGTLDGLMAEFRAKYGHIADSDEGATELEAICRAKAADGPGAYDIISERKASYFWFPLLLVVP